jgi:hypothetical protein
LSADIDGGILGFPGNTNDGIEHTVDMIATEKSMFGTLSAVGAIIGKHTGAMIMPTERANQVNS